MIMYIQANTLLLKCFHSWKNYCTSKRMLRAKMEHVHTRLKHAVLSRCLMQWSNEVGIHTLYAAIVSYMNITVHFVSVFYDRLSKQELFEHAYNNGITIDKV